MSEDVHLRLDRAFLERLAEACGGTYAPIEDVRTMLGAVEPRTARDIDVTEWQIWNWMALMLVLAMLLTVDWIVIEPEMPFANIQAMLETISTYERE